MCERERLVLLAKPTLLCEENEKAKVVNTYTCQLPSEYFCFLNFLFIFI